MRYLKKLNQAGFDHMVVLVVFIAAFALVGSFLLMESRAAAWSGELQMGLDKSLCMDNLGSKTSNGNTIDVYSCNKTAAQKWTINVISGNTFTLSNGQGTCADDWGDGVGTNTANRVYLKTYKCNKADKAQVWEWENSQLENVYSHGCINDPGNSKTPGTALVVYSCSPRTSNALWYEAAQSGAGGGSNASICTQEGGNILGGTCYFWVQSFQNNDNNFSASGVSAVFSQPNPTIKQTPGSGIDHTVMEIFASSPDGKQSVEIGWYKDPGKKVPILFTTDWVNGNFIGYAENGGTGFVNTSSSVKPGNSIPTGKPGTYKIQIVNNQVHAYWDNVDFGYFPQSVWSSRGVSFTKIGWVSVYGEVAVNNGHAATAQMGDGTLGSKSGAATVSGYTLIGANTPSKLVNFAGPSGTVPAQHYNYGGASATGFSYGGPGW